MQINELHEQHKLQIKNEVMINVNVSVKSIACPKRFIVGILSHF